MREKFLQKKIAVAHRAVGGVDVEAASALRCGDQEITHFMLLTEIIEQAPAAATEQGLLVIAQSVQEIKHWITSRRMLGRAGVISGGQIDAIMNDLLEDVAVERAAVDAALSGGWTARNQNGDQRQDREEPEREPVQTHHRSEFTRSAAPARDRVSQRVRRD